MPRKDPGRIARRGSVNARRFHPEQPHLASSISGRVKVPLSSQANLETRRQESRRLIAVISFWFSGRLFCLLFHGNLG